MHSKVVAEEEGGALVGISQEFRDAVSEPLEGIVTPAGLQDNHREVELKAEAPEHGVPVHLQAEGLKDMTACLK